MMEWISVKDAFPFDEQFVLVMHASEGICLGFRWRKYKECKECKENGIKYPEAWLWKLVDMKFHEKVPLNWWVEPLRAVDDEITHWMPLPKLPEELRT